MHDYGRMPASSVATLDAPGDAPPAPWELARVTIQQVTYEPDQAAALDLLPDVFSRPVPPYARLSVVDYPDSPVGPYREALLMLSCRYMLLPRHWIVASVVTSEAARAANARNWGYASEVGEVALEQTERGFVGRIAAPGALSMTVDSSGAQQTAGAIIRYDPQVNLGPPEDGADGPTVLHLGPTLGEVHDAYLARGTTVTYDGGDRSSPWLRLRLRNPITCTIGVQDLVRPEPAPVRRPAGGGGGGLP